MAERAFALIDCRDTWVQMKFTAGLHHPIRHWDPALETHVHGFLNIFAAGVLAHVRKLDETRVLEIIEDEDADHFAFDAEGFRWQDVRATTQEISWARQMAVTSFGSCSFDEPRGDLVRLGWLPS